MLNYSVAELRVKTNHYTQLLYLMKYGKDLILRGVLQLLLVKLGNLLLLLLVRPIMDNVGKR